MATIGDVKIRIGAIINPLVRDLKKVERQLQRSGQRLSRLGNDLTLSVSAPLALLGGKAITTAGNIEALELSMESMMGSAEMAAKELKLLEEAAKLPGLGFEQAIRGSVKLQAVGFSAEEARKALKAFGNGIALAGGSASDLDGVALALTQIASKGKISAEEINQLAERVPQIRAAMKAAFGTADTEQLQKLGIEAKDFVNTMVKEFEKLPQATSGIKNAMENTGIALTKFFATIGKDINETFNVQGNLEIASRALEKVAKAFTKLSPTTKKAILGFTGFLVAVGPVVKIMGLLKLGLASAIGGFINITKAIKTATIAFASFNKVQKAIAIGSVIGLIGLAISTFSSFSDALDRTRLGSQRLVEVNKAVAQAAGAETRAVNQAFEALKKETGSRKEKKEAIDKLLEQYPDYFKGIDLEKANISQLDGLQKKLNKSILEGVAARKKSEALDAIYSQILEKQLEIQRIEKEGFSGLSFVEQFNTDSFGLGNREQGESGKDFAVRSKIEGLQEELKKLQSEADKTTQAFDGLFGTRRQSGRGISPVFGEQEENTTSDTSTTSFIPVADGAKKATKDLQNLQTVSQDLQKEFDLIDNKAALLGGTMGDKLGKKTAFLKNKITELLEDGFKPFSPEVALLKGELDKLENTEPLKFIDNEQLDLAKVSLQSVGEEVQQLISTVDGLQFNPKALGQSLEEAKEIFASFKENIEANINQPLTDAQLKAQETAEKINEGFANIIESGITDALIGIGEGIGKIAAGTGSFADLAGVALKNLAGMLEQLGKLAIETGVATLGIKTALKSLNGYVAIAAGVALVALAQVVKAKAANLTPMADGGLLYGPTPILAGEYPGARSNPEVIAPLNKLQSMLNIGGPQEVRVIGEFKMRGDHLYAMVEKQQNYKNRTRGF